VNYNSGNMLYHLLKRLVSYPLKVVVVDNASTDDSLVDIPCLTDHVIRNNKNRLYAKAANQGIKYALENGADKILLLNFDLELTDDFLKKLIKSKSDIVGPMIRYDKVWSCGGKLDIYKGIIEQ